MSDEPAKIVLGDTAITAIERTPGRRRFSRSKDPHRVLTHCENCGAQLIGHYCAQCGQAAVDYRRSFGHVILDVLNEFVNWDSKILGTIGLLITRPWRLTNEFLEGKRVRHAHPLRLYLVAGFLFFLGVNYGAKGLRFEPGKLGPKDRAELEADLKKGDLPPAAREQLEALLRESSPSPASSPSTNTPPPAPSASSNTPSPAASATTDKQKQEYGKIGERPFAVFDSDKKSSTPFERWIEGRAKEKMGEHGTKMGLFIATLFSNLPYMMLCCIPLFAFVLKILYVRRHIFYIDHLIYALHIHTFAYVGIMLIVLATIGLNRVAPGPIAAWIIALLWIAFVVQIFLSIRRVYSQGWLVSSFKFLFGGFLYLMVLVAALVATLLRYTSNAMKKIILLGFALAFSPVSGFCGDRQIAFERDQAVWIAKLDGTGERKIADGIFPAISPDGTRVAFNTTEKTSDTSYVRHIAVVDVATGKIDVFKDVPSDNSYYPSWTTDGKQILFTTRPHEVWDLVTINSDGTNFHVLKPGVQNEVTRYSPIWARDGQSVFCEDMTNMYQIGLDGAVRTQWKIGKIVPKGDMSADGRIDVSPDGKRLLLSIDMGEESGRKDWDGPLPALWAFDLQSQKATRLTPKKLFGWDGVWIDNDNVLFLSRAAGEENDSIYRMSADGKNLKRLIKNGRFPSVSAP